MNSSSALQDQLTAITEPDYLNVDKSNLITCRLHVKDLSDSVI